MKLSLLEKYDGFLFDIDGTITLGERLLPGARDVIDRLAAFNKPYLLLTNNPYRETASMAQQLQRLGIPVDESQIVTAGMAAAHLVRERIGAGAVTYVMGSEALLNACRKAGLIVTQKGREPGIRAAVVGGFMDFSYDHLREANWAVRACELFTATNRDPVFPTEEGLWPGTGAIVAAVETASGRKAITAGKPSPFIYAMAREVIGKADRLLMVGDSLDTDIAGGQQAGMDTALVRTGNGARASVSDHGDVRPTYTIETLQELLI